jgi:hypothetical protein
MEILVVIILVVAIIAALILVRGFVFYKLWSWFLTPLGLPEIGLAHAIGVGLVITYMTHQIMPADEKDRSGERLAYTLIGTLLVLAIGWIISNIM